MLRFVARRIVETMPVLFIIATLTFFMMRLAPGGPFDKEKASTPEIRKAIEAYYGLDRPFLEQYLKVLKGYLQGDLGPDYKYPNRTVNELIGDSFPVSLELGLLSLLIALVLGITAGLIAAVRRNSVFDYSAMSLAMIGICLPTFVMGPILALLFAIHLHWFNASGWDFARDRVLPAMTLGCYFAAFIARLTRGGMLEMLSQDFVRTAKAKGASTARILFKHALRGGIAPVVSFLGPAAAGLITGSFVVETIFDIPGLGRFFITSAFNRDYTLVLGVVLFYATLIVLFNLAVDIAQVWLNPKLKLE